MKTLQAKIDSIAFGGDGVGKVDGKICFVRGALPDEEVVFKVVKEASSYIKGEVEEVLNKSAERVEPPCEYYGICGGCDSQHMRYESELSAKRSQITELFRRIGGLNDFNCDEIVPSKDDYFYRSHVTLNKSKDGYGFYSRDKKNIINIRHCHIASKEMNTLIDAGLFVTKKDRVTLKVDHQGNVWTSGVPGQRFFVDRFSGTDIFLSPMAFSQCNRDISQKMSERLKDWIGKIDDGTAFFDIYCGCGFFTFLLSQDFDITVGMDYDRVSIDCAKTTKRKYQKDNVKFYKGDVEKEFVRIFEKNKRPHNILLLDPPRKGISKYFLEWLRTDRDITGIYFISCDPSRMARDTKVLLGNGVWTLGRVSGFDMFPRTKHIEVMAEFIRN